MSATNEAVVRDFLESMAVPNTKLSRSLLADDVVWKNTGLPTVRGRRVGGMIGSMEKYKIGFGVDFHKVTSAGDEVVTHRTDYLQLGPVRQSIEIEGHFTVRDGKITLWDDRFSWLQTLRSTRLGGRVRA